MLLTAWTHLESARDRICLGAADYGGKPRNGHRLMTTVANLFGFSANRCDPGRHHAHQRCERHSLERDHDLRGQGEDQGNHASQFRAGRWPARRTKLRDTAEAQKFGVDASAHNGACNVLERKCEAVDGGTLFLDEIGNPSVAGPIKLLRLLEAGRFQRLGSERDCQLRKRVVSASNCRPAVIDCRAALPRRSLLPLQRDGAAAAGTDRTTRRYPPARP